MSIKQADLNVANALAGTNLSLVAADVFVGGLGLTVAIPYWYNGLASVYATLKAGAPNARQTVALRSAMAVMRDGFPSLNLPDPDVTP